MHIQLLDTDAMFQTVILSSKSGNIEKINLYKPVDGKVYFSELKVSKLLHLSVHTDVCMYSQLIANYSVELYTQMYF